MLQYRITGFIIALLFVAVFLQSGAHAANDKAFCWQVDSADATVYLMGSIHFADPGFYPLRKEIEQAYKRSGSLVVELNVNNIDADAYNQLLSQKGVFKNGKTIKDVISEETWLQLRQRLRHLNVDYERVKNYKPGMLVLTLTAIQVMKMGFDPQLGIDAYFLNKAAAENRNIIELESLEQQVNLFLNIPDGELLLKESLYSLEESELLMADIVRFWKQGDEAKLNQLMFVDALNQYPAFGAIYDRLFYHRNDSMTEKIEVMLQSKQEDNVYFVVVGSGHLIGEKGIVNSLKEKGYAVKRF